MRDKVPLMPLYFISSNFLNVPGIVHASSDLFFTSKVLSKKDCPQRNIVLVCTKLKHSTPCIQKNRMVSRHVHLMQNRIIPIASVASGVAFRFVTKISYFVHNTSQKVVPKGHRQLLGTRLFGKRLDAEWGGCINAKDKLLKSRLFLPLGTPIN